MASPQFKAYKQEWYKANRKRICDDRRRTHNEARQKVLEHYDNKCACCGETTPEFLGIDHINGGGKKHRNAVGDICKWLVRNKFPEGFQVLCHNCNLAKQFYGGCPHGRKHVKQAAAA